MASELLVSRTTGSTVYAVIRVPNDKAGATNNIGKWANDSLSVFEAFAAGNWADYALTMTELGSTGLYEGDIPSWIAATLEDVLEVIFFDQAGANPAMTDTKIDGVSISKTEDGWQAVRALSV